LFSSYPERTQAVIDRYGLPERTENTITNPEALFEEVESARAEGVAFNDEESTTGFRAVASPVSAPDGWAGGLVVSGPKNRLYEQKFSETVPKIVSGAANAHHGRLCLSYDPEALGLLRL
jgi:DNA-binding IclR family transcriptional regulator